VDSAQNKLQQNRAEVGAKLAEGRATAGLSVAEVAQALHTSQLQIKLLESGDWHRIGPGAFGRGFARAYGRLVKVELGDLDHCIEPTLADDLDVKAAALSRKRRAKVVQAQRFATYTAASALVGIPLVLLLASAFRGEFKSEGLIPQDTVLASLLPRSGSHNELRISASADAVVRVTSEDGELVGQFQLRAGDDRLIDAPAGSLVRIENPDSVIASLDGQPLPLTPYRVQQAVELRIPAKRQ